MLRRKDPARLQNIQQAFEEGGDRRPPLYQWMLTHYEELLAMFDGARPNWQHLTKAFADEGFRNGAGGDLTPETVRQTWYHVRKRKQARRTQPASVMVLNSPAPVPRTTSIPSPTTTTPPLPADDPLAAIRAEMNRRSGRA